MTASFIKQEVREEEFRKQQATNTELLNSLLLGSSSQQEKTEQGLKSINKQLETEGERYTRLVVKVRNMTGISETLLRDVTDIRNIFSNFKTDVNDKIDSLNDILGIDSANKTFQIANLSQQINTTSNDLLNLHLKIGNISTSLNSLEDIKQHLIHESQRMISKSENISKENESTRLLLRNISEIYFTKLSNQSGSENKEISEAIGRVFGSVKLLGNSLGQS